MKHEKLNKTVLGGIPLTHTQVWIWVIGLFILLHTATAQPKSDPRCFLAVHSRRGWWTARDHNHQTIAAKKPHTVTTSRSNTAYRGAHRSEAVAYTLTNKQRPHRGHPITVAFGLAHIRDEWPPIPLGQEHTPNSTLSVSGTRREPKRTTHRPHNFHQTHHRNSTERRVLQDPSKSIKRLGLPTEIPTSGSDQALNTI